MAPDDKEKTAFNTKYVHFKFLVISMSLRNLPGTFQSLINKIFCDRTNDFLVVYLDDILVNSNSGEEQQQQLRTVLKRLRHNKLYVGMRKFETMTTKTEFIDHLIGRNGIKIGYKRNELVQEGFKPSIVLDLQGFISLMQFYRQFIQKLSEIAAPRTTLPR